MAYACPGLIDHGDALQVNLISGQLESVDGDALLSGANMAVIGDGTSDNWEVFQFKTAELIGTNSYLLSDRLRGQAGSDGLIPDIWPAGSQFVLLNSVPLQIDLSRNMRGVEQNYRVGPALRSADDPSYRQFQRAFSGNGLRPYAPAHLRVAVQPNGALSVTWVRRTRIDGDSWEALEVPLGEETETYVLRMVKDGVMLREEVLDTSAFEYSSGAQASDGAGTPFSIEVAQVSATFGVGLFQRIGVSTT
jgi:hypothetical protein